jgi:cell division septal protein FtsQ
MPKLRKPTIPSARVSKTYKRAPLTSYYRSNNEPGKASPFKKRQPKTNRRKLLFGALDIILIILLVFGLVYSLMLKAQPKISATDLSYHPLSVYTSQITPFFNSISDHNKITFNEGAVAASIQKQFPEVQTVRVELPFFSETPIVWLTISPPVFNLQSGGRSFIVDSQGIVVAKTTDLPKLKNLVNLTDQSGYPAVLGKQVLSSSSVDFINTVIKQAQHAKVPISTLSLPPLAQELDLRTSDAPYYVKFYLGGDALTQSGQFLASRQKFNQTHQAPSEYLDVRVSGKIFYK